MPLNHTSFRRSPEYWDIHSRLILYTFICLSLESLSRWFCSLPSSWCLSPHRSQFFKLHSFLHQLAPSFLTLHSPLWLQLLSLKLHLIAVSSALNSPAFSFCRQIILNALLSYCATHRYQHIQNTLIFFNSTLLQFPFADFPHKVVLDQPFSFEPVPFHFFNLFRDNYCAKFKFASQCSQLLDVDRRRSKLKHLRVLCLLVRQ